MPRTRPLTAEQQARADKLVYHHVDCKDLAGLRISLTEQAQGNKRTFLMLGLSSRETIATALRAVDVSPFKTVFVVREATGEVLYALSKNESYVALAKKKRPKPDPAPAPPTGGGECCQLCAMMGGTSCQPLSDGSCICFGADRGGTTAGTLSDDLEVLA